MTLPCPIDLHLHLDGSLSPATVRTLAAMQDIPLPAEDAQLAARLTVGAECPDLNTYLEKFDFPCSLLQTAPALTHATHCLLAELAAQGLLYAELRFAPQKHTNRGLTQTQVVAAVLAGMEAAPIGTGLILCCMRGNTNTAENRETVQVAAQHFGHGVVALDLAGAEALFPTRDFSDLFADARACGIPYTIHAGEAAGAESVAAALQMGASRIGHGVRVLEDKAVLAQLAEQQIPLELCPTSNLHTGVFASISDYPLRELLAAGIHITINTDNTTVSHTTLQTEWERLDAAFHLTAAEVMRMTESAIDAAFADAETKTWLRGSLHRT